MCGVAAAVGRRADAQVRRMVEAMSYRGIRTGVYDSVRGSVGHVRLPIVGVGEDHDQPVQVGRWLLAFAGELLDFRETDPEYECDLELVKEIWRRNGPGGFIDRDGFWAVVALDRRSREIFALVDYLSQRPLYMRSDEEATAVASEPDALALLGPVELDEVYLSAVVKWGYCPEVWRTPYRSVRRMLPGECAVLKYGEPPVTVEVDPLLPVVVGEEELREEIERAVERRVRSSDVRVACLLSGGLDSSIVAHLARRYGDLAYYHAENGEYDELCRSLPAEGAPEVVLLGMDRAPSLEEALEYMQEPLDLGSLIPQVMLSRGIAAAGAERVCLTGDGADELFGGYGRSRRYDSQGSDVYHELVGWHLPRLDRVMSRSRIEVRSPFLARRVAGAALALPRERRTGKAVLRDLFREVLPPGVADVPKRPLRTPEVEADREGRSEELVRLFRRRVACLG